jgi:uncharacterized protein (TIGR02598 family)
MKLFRLRTHRNSSAGFSLVESVLSVGVLSFGFISLAPLLALGLTRAGAARENQATAQIASTLIEEARQGTLAAGTIYLDSVGNPCAAAQAAYAVQDTSTPIAAGSGSAGGAALTRLSLRIAPLGAPGSARIYADVFPTPPSS